MLPSSAGASSVFGGRPSSTSASMLRPASGPSVNIAVTVGPISAAGIAWPGSAALQALAERPGHGIAGGINPELGLHPRDPLPDRVQAQKQLPRELGLALDDGGRAQHLALARGQPEPVKRVRQYVRHDLLEQQS